MKKFGQLDILVNNASFQGKSVEKFEDIDRERLEFTFHSNILNYFSTSQAAVKHMKEGAVIINVGSIQGYNPSPGVLDYSCTKVAVGPRCMHSCALASKGPPEHNDMLSVKRLCFWHKPCCEIPCIGVPSLHGRWESAITVQNTPLHKDRERCHKLSCQTADCSANPHVQLHCQ